MAARSCAAAWRTASSTVGAPAMANSSDWPSTSTWTRRRSPRRPPRAGRGCRVSERDAALLVAMAQCARAGGAFGRQPPPQTSPPQIVSADARRRGPPRLIVRRRGGSGSGIAVDRVGPHLARRAWPAGRSASAGSAGWCGRPGRGARARASRSRVSAAARSGPWTMSLASIGSYRSHHLVALADARVDPHAGRPAEAAPRARWPAGSPRPDPPRTGGPRSRVPRSGPRACSMPSGSPAAMRSWSATRSRPVTASVTGCSTCSRVFISRKWKPPAVVEQELDRAGALVADGRGHRQRSRAHPHRAAAHPRPAPATPPRSSGCRRWAEQSRSPRWTPAPCRSNRTWTSTCRGPSSRRSRMSRSSPKARAASRRAAARASGRLVRVADDVHPLATARRPLA